MDNLALQTLRDELLDDCRVTSDAFGKAASRFERREEVAYEGCAHHLCRLYNAFEQMGLRVAKAFENNIDDEQGWPERPAQSAGHQDRRCAASPDTARSEISAARIESVSPRFRACLRVGTRP